MNTHCEPSVPFEQLEPGKSPTPAAKVAVRSATTGQDETFFHLDLLRSLRLHRRLVIGILVAGVAVAAAYLLTTWPVAESLDIQSSTAQISRNVIMLLAATLLVAVVAAVGAHNFDSRVYVATDVERALGFGPMTQLPDFHQVSSAVGDEFLLRLAGAIEHNCCRSRFKSCLFTGATAGVGATTLAIGVRSKLEGMGRKTVLVDASGLTHAVPEAEAVDATTKNRPSVLLQQQMADEMDSETIVLTDTAPLLTSGETRYLARFVDSAIVVIQSGLTTRAQLREIAQTLLRLEVPVVGFVLNRVSIEKANPSFRQSIRAVEQRLKLQDRLCACGPSEGSSSVEYEREIVQKPIVVTKPKVVKPPVQEQSPAASREPAVASRSTAASSAAAETERVAVVSEAAPATAPRTTRGRGEPVRPASEPKISKPVATSPKSAPQLTEPVAATLTPLAAAPDAAPPVRRAPEARTPPKAPPSPVPPPVNMEPSPDDVAMEREEPSYTTASRLGGLRNLLVSLGRRSLKDAEFAGDEPDLEPRFERAKIRPAYPDAEAPGGDIDSAATGPSPVRVTAQPEFIRPKTMPEVEKDKEPVRPTSPSPRENKEGQDEIQTLPSWRGQYRKKRYPQI
jgi:Mrp family chromosome partitioning ATPase